ncbi:MAG: sensor domain-containing protein [Ilumatobacteraceae bacterium]|nr:sensor domain-containing protein [Ilumatobacteraceae bacterium]
MSGTAEMKRIFAPLAKARTWSASLHLLLDMPLGIAWFVIAIVGLSVGVGLVVVALVGLAVLAATVFAGRLIGIVERTRAEALLGIQVTSPPARVRPEGTWAGLRSFLTDPVGWKGLGYGMLMLPLGIMNFTIVVTMWAIALAGTTYPVWGWAVPTNFGDNHVLHGWLKAGYISGTFVVGVLMLIAAPRVIRGLAAMDGGLIKGLLGGSPTAELRQRVETLTVSRDASVDIAETERRRIERDLHDGVQAQLVTLAMDLGMARQKLESGDDADPAVLALVERAHDDSKRAVADLRNLVRGIHPAVLTDRGLDAAVSALAARSPISVEVHISLPTRPPATVESTAYFVIAEALTNAAKHSGASVVHIDGSIVAGMLRVEIRDDGRGGASVEHGGGLAGLASRVAANEGRLRVASPVGGPTTVLAELPLPSGSFWPPPDTTAS